MVTLVAESPSYRPAMLSRWLWIVVSCLIIVLVVGGVTRLREGEGTVVAARGGAKAPAADKGSTALER